MDKKYTLNSWYAAWYCGYLPPAPPKASCHVSMRINIFSLTFRSGCKRQNIQIYIKDTIQVYKMQSIRYAVWLKHTFFFTIFTMSCKISRSTICRWTFSPQFLLRVSSTCTRNSRISSKQWKRIQFNISVTHMVLVQVCTPAPHPCMRTPMQYTKSINQFLCVWFSLMLYWKRGSWVLIFDINFLHG